jgi:hypothetical protein
MSAILKGMDEAWLSNICNDLKTEPDLAVLIDRYRLEGSTLQEAGLVERDIRFDRAPAAAHHVVGADLSFSARFLRRRSRPRRVRPRAPGSRVRRL